jgi:hypothetical protein
MTYIEEMDAVAEARMNLRRFPFDHQRLYAIFEVLGLDADSVVLRQDPTSTGAWSDENHWIHVPQWHPPALSTTVREYDPVYGGETADEVSSFVVNLDMKRNPGYMVRLVLFPLTSLVILSWSVFWMSRSSLGDRMDISFIGILTIVAYQITISGLMPKIAYTTVLGAYLIISFLMMCASVIVNLAVDRIDQKGHFALGDRVDLHCRWVFPLTYLLLLLFVCGRIFWLG